MAETYWFVGASYDRTSSVRLKAVQIQLVKRIGLFCNQPIACEGLR